MPEADLSKAFSCLRCGLFTAPTGRTLTLHMASDCEGQKGGGVGHFDDLNSFTYFCVYCDRDFEKAIQWLNHMKESHPGEHTRLFKSKTCPSCGKAVSGPMKRHFAKEGPFHLPECNLCHIQVRTEP